MFSSKQEIHQIDSPSVRTCRIHSDELGQILSYGDAGASVQFVSKDSMLRSS